MIRKFKKISMKEAKRRYEDGEAIHICPSKLRAENSLGCYTEINASYDGDFETFVEAFALYNCSDETGVHVTFYVQKPEKQYQADYIIGLC